jgi:hypothetical protein
VVEVTCLHPNTRATPRESHPGTQYTSPVRVAFHQPLPPFTTTAIKPVSDPPTSILYGDPTHPEQRYLDKDRHGFMTGSPVRMSQTYFARHDNQEHYERAGLHTHTAELGGARPHTEAQRPDSRPPGHLFHTPHHTTPPFATTQVSRPHRRQPHMITTN